ncbi:uncharacterized protein [Chironomus tepperi]|uniref:uncharacterized protein n=1 Tax=Chironomus tepperi TaxID=113505 RepID=UPI00391F7E02
MSILPVFILTISITAISALNFNITNLSNCDDIPLDYTQDAEIEVADVTYEANEMGFYDTLHGKYIVHIHQLDHIDIELVITFFKCPKGAVGPCKNVLKEYVESITCKRFLEDKSGPWYVFAPAMDTKNLCAKLVGTYQFTKAHLNGTYIENYMDIEEGHYRIRMLNHVPGRNMDIKNLRGCVEIDFDIV